MDEVDARIGTLNSGKFYAYPHGNDQEPVMGTLSCCGTRLLVSGGRVVRSCTPLEDGQKL